MRRYLNLIKRNIHGVLLLDKPVGVSSSFLSNRMKKLFCANKAGHAGTLDPLATGMLPICFGKATKFVEQLLNFDKKYRVRLKLGESTDTFDSNGIIIKISPIQFNLRKLQQCLNNFKGKSFQVPPMFSSLKYHGLPLYKYARQGITVPRKPRMIYVYELTILNQDINIIELDMMCSKGTYVRSFVNDFGDCLGCGAHVTGLRRLMIGRYLPDSMINIQVLESIFYNSNLNDLEVLNKLDDLLISVESLSNLAYSC